MPNNKHTNAGQSLRTATRAVARDLADPRFETLVRLVDLIVRFVLDWILPMLLQG